MGVYIPWQLSLIFELITFSLSLMKCYRCHIEFFHLRCSDTVRSRSPFAPYLCIPCAQRYRHVAYPPTAFVLSSQYDRFVFGDPESGWPGVDCDFERFMFLLYLVSLLF